MSTPSPLAGQVRPAAQADAPAGLNGAAVFVDCLKREGVTHVFGVPGGQTLSIMDVLFDTPEITFVTTRHEGAAACMADAYGRLTGRPGVALATTGPGATNMITGVGGAHRDSSPALIVTCNNRRRHIGTDDNQDADHLPLFRQFTKSSRFVPEADAVAYATREAFRIALAGNPGPVHLDFARDAIETGAVALEPLAPAAYRTQRRAVADDASLTAAARVIQAAERPILWLGRGTVVADAAEPALALARLLGAPVVTTFNGIGAVGDDPLVFGPRSRFGTRLSRRVVTDADCIIAVGNSLNAASTSRWTLALTGNLVQIDIDPTVVGRNYPVAAAVIGDAGDALVRLAGALQPHLADRAAARRRWLEAMTAAREAWQREVFPPGLADDAIIKPQWLMQCAARVIDRQTTVIADAGNPGVWSHLLPIRRPGGYMKPVGFGNMGFGLPAAIAAKLVRPEDKVLAFVGDGSLGMTLAEIETAVRLSTPIALVVLNDCGYGNIKQEELHYFGQRHIGVDFTDARYADVALALGARGERVTRPDQVPAALDRALSADLPYLVDVTIDPHENVWEDVI